MGEEFSSKTLNEAAWGFVLVFLSKQGLWPHSHILDALFTRFLCSSLMTIRLFYSRSPCNFLGSISSTTEELQQYTDSQNRRRSATLLITPSIAVFLILLLILSCQSLLLGRFACDVGDQAKREAHQVVPYHPVFHWDESLGNEDSEG